MLKQTQVKTLELNKMQAVQDRSEHIGGFLDWLMGEGITLARWDRHGCESIDKTIEQLLAEYFGIDLAKCEQERRALLDVAREGNESS